MPSLPPQVLWAFLTAGLALSAILLAFATALVIYQRRFAALHRAHAEGLLRAQEQERAWVARELHDDALQRIAIMIHELDGLGNGGTAARAELEDLGVVLRRIANHLHPAFVEREGLIPALRRLAGELSRTMGVALTVREDAPDITSLASAQALVAYRIAQEALNNLIRHSGAKEGTVRLHANGRTLELTVADRGRGFGPEGGRKAGHLGLISMEERARAAGGKLSVTSQPGVGTEVRLRLPYREPA